MLKSDTIGELTKALVNVQAKIKGAKKDEVNPFFKSKYADLSSVWEACRDLLAENGLAVIQTTSAENCQDGEIIIETILAHSSGEWIGGELLLPLAKNDPQGVGSAITYGRRYGLSAIVGICPEDDDAEIAQGRGTKQVSTTAETKTEVAQPTSITEAQQRKIFAASKQKDIVEEVKLYMSKVIGKAHTKELTKAEASQLIEAIEGDKIKKNPALVNAALQEGAEIEDDR